MLCNPHVALITESQTFQIEVLTTSESREEITVVRLSPKAVERGLQETLRKNFKVSHFLLSFSRLSQYFLTIGSLSRIFHNVHSRWKRHQKRHFLRRREKPHAKWGRRHWSFGAFSRKWKLYRFRRKVTIRSRKSHQGHKTSLGCRCHSFASFRGRFRWMFFHRTQRLCG